MTDYTPEEVERIAALTAKKILALADPDDELHPDAAAFAALLAARTVEGLLGAGIIVPGEDRR